MRSLDNMIVEQSSMILSFMKTCHDAADPGELDRSSEGAGSSILKLIL